VILRRHRLREVVRGVGLHVGVVHLRWILLMLMLIVGPPSTHIRRHALPRRQMTTVHHAGLGDSSSKPTASWIGLELRVADRIVGDAACLLRVEMVSASKIEDEVFRVSLVEESALWDCRFGGVA
jgi:hypothetical protein